MTTNTPLTIRCPKDIDEATHTHHVALDLRMPLEMNIAIKVLDSLPKCPCGAALWIVRDVPRVGDY